MANPIVTSLPAYIGGKENELISKVSTGANSVKYFRIQTGVKGTTALNILTTDVEFGSGKDCGWSDAGTSTISARNIASGDIKINQSFCDHKLIGTYAENLVKVAAGVETLPFEEVFVNGVISDIAKKLDKAIWLGDTASTDVNLSQFDGLLKILTDDSDVVTLTAGTDVYENIKNVAAAMPVDTFLGGEGVIFVGEDLYRQYVMALVEKNFYHYDANAVVYVPATNIEVVPTVGLNGTGAIVGSNSENFVYGTDLEGSDEQFKFWYSDDNLEFRLVVKFTAGVLVVFPSDVVVSK